MNTKTTYALVLSMALIVFSLLLIILQGSVGATSLWLIGLLSWPMAFFILWHGLRAMRDEKPGQCITFKQAFLAGLVISLIAAAAMGVYMVLHCTLINPGYADQAMELARQQWEAKGLNDQQMEVAERFARIFMHPALMVVFQIVGTILKGAICALIAAAIVKRNPQPALPAGCDSM